jgi:uridine phosphorylase
VAATACQGRHESPGTKSRTAAPTPNHARPGATARNRPSKVAGVPRRLRPTAEIHPRAILVGDPGRAMALAQVLTAQPKMSNHARGLWGYSGEAGDGGGLTVQATGMGGPSAALVLSDLAELGVRRAVRVGTCAALAGDLRPGDLVEAREARPLSVDGRGAGVPAFPDEELAEGLRQALGEAARPGTVASLDDLHPRPGNATPDGDVVDMQTAGLLAKGRGLDVAVAAVLVVTDAEGFEPLRDDELAERAFLASQAALIALA